MPYAVKEMYYTLQGEGFHAGRAAVFCRFTGCNLWSGREEDRQTAACWFCDTDFVGTDGENGGKFSSAADLANAIAELWPQTATASPMVVFTGGEPLLQLDSELIDACKTAGFYTAVETNGTIQAPANLDWITVSPKPNSTLVQKRGSELKLVYPHEVKPESVAGLDFEHFFLSPLTSEKPGGILENAEITIEYCLKNLAGNSQCKPINYGAFPRHLCLITMVE